MWPTSCQGVLYLSSYGKTTQVRPVARGSIILTFREATDLAAGGKEMRSSHVKAQMTTSKDAKQVRRERVNASTFLSERVR